MTTNSHTSLKRADRDSRLASVDRRHALTAFAVALCMSIFSVGVVSAQAEPTKRTVVDMDGVAVTVPQEIKSFFNGFPVSNGFMALLGVSEAQSHYLPRMGTASWGWLHVFNPLILQRPTIGTDAMASAEEVLTINPDVIIMANKDTAEAYRAAGLEVFSVRTVTTETFLQSIVLTGELFGGAAAERAESYVRYYQENIDLAAERLGTLAPEDRPTVYYVSGATALNTAVSGNGREFVTNAGGRYAAEALLPNPGNAEITAEQLLSLDPDYIIVGTNNRAAGFADLMASPALAGLSAIKSGHVYKTPQGTLPWDTYGPEQAMAVLWMGKILHPDLFADIDLKLVMKDFYKRFFDYELRDDYADEMLSGLMAPAS